MSIPTQYINVNSSVQRNHLIARYIQALWISKSKINIRKISKKMKISLPLFSLRIYNYLFPQFLNKVFAVLDPKWVIVTRWIWIHLTLIQRSAWIRLYLPAMSQILWINAMSFRLVKNLYFKNQSKIILKPKDKDQLTPNILNSRYQKLWLRYTRNGIWEL